LLEPLTVEAYGGRMPLSQVASVSAGDARTLNVQVWDAGMVSAVDKAIQAFGLMPRVEGVTLRVTLPDLSQERRQELVKMAKSYAEEAKIGGRNLRRAALDSAENQDLSEDALQRIKKEVQKMTDDFVNAVDRILADKEREILKV
jgi:ribosome recycling factor